MKKELSFEEQIQRLQEIIGQLEDGSQPLDQALSLYEEGSKLVKNAQKKLEDAELRLQKVTSGKDGVVEISDFSSNNGNLTGLQQTSNE